MKNKVSIAFLIIFMSTIIFAQNKSSTDYFAQNGFGNPVVGNACEYYKGVTYVAYQGPLEDPYVAAYNHKTKTWSGPFKAGLSLLGKTPDKKTDNHGKPTLVIDSNGYIHLAFGGHGGTLEIGKNPLGNYHDGKQIHVVSKNPQDITSWKVADNISPFGTYSQFIKMDNNDLYLFYRHGAHRSNWVYQLSKDDGVTFSKPVSILKTKKTTGTQENPIIFDSWYIHFSKGLGNDIIAAYNYHVCKGPKHDGERHNAYYMRFDTDKTAWYNVKGEKLILPITKEHADIMTLVKNTGDLWTHNGISRVDPEGNPHITSYEGKHEGLIHGGAKEIKHYRWSGQEWMGGETNGLPIGAKGEMLIKSHTEISMLIGYKENNIGEVAWWKSTNGGKNFTKKEVLISQKGANFDLTNFIRHANIDAQILVASKNKSNLRNMFLIGDNGPVKRNVTKN